MNTPITTTAQRGTLTYIKGDYTYKTIEGWFHHHGTTIVMRKIGGRNQFNFITTSQVLDFQPHQRKQ
jgi:hypothetical protein